MKALKAAASGGRAKLVNRAGVFGLAFVLLSALAAHAPASAQSQPARPSWDPQPAAARSAPQPSGNTAQAATQQAQTPQPASPSAGANATDGAGQAWRSNCRGEGDANICDVTQSLVDQTNGVEAVRVSFARQRSTGRLGLLIKVPLGFRLDTGAMLRINRNDTLSIQGVAFNRCTAADGCIAEKPLSSSEFNNARAASGLEVVVLNLQGQPVIVPLVVEGLAQALAGL